MGLIYPQNRFNPDKPVLVDGMSLNGASVPNTDTKLPFSEVDVSRMTDLSELFYGRVALIETPVIDSLTGKTGLTTMLQGCISLLYLRFKGIISDSLQINSYKIDIESLVDIANALDVNNPKTLTITENQKSGAATYQNASILDGNFRIAINVKDENYFVEESGQIKSAYHIADNAAIIPDGNMNYTQVIQDIKGWLLSTAIVNA